MDYADWLIYKEEAMKKRVCANENCRAMMKMVLNGTLDVWVCRACGLEVYVDPKSGECRTIRWSSIKRRR